MYGSKKKSQDKFKKYFELKENENTIKICEMCKVVLRGKFIALNAYIRKEKSQ